MRRKLLLIVSILCLFCFGKVYAISQLQDGNYKIQVDLWHMKDDKPSMGNKSLNKNAEIEVKDGKYFLYIETGKIKVQNIESSLLNFYYEDEDGNFRKAEEGCYDIEIKDDINKRPRIFKIPLKNLDKYHEVLVDPKVAVMGKNPIPARLKLNSDSLKSIKEDESDLINDFSNSEQKEINNVKNDYKIFLKYNENSFNDDFDFFAEEFDDNKKLDLKKEITSGIIISAYSIEAQKKLNFIPGDKLTEINDIRQNIQPNNDVEITIEGTYPENLRIFDLDNKKDIEYKKDKDRLIIKTSYLGKIALISKEDKEIINSDKIKKPDNKTAEKNIVKIKPNKIKKNIKPDNFKKETNSLNINDVMNNNIKREDNTIKTGYDKNANQETVYENHYIILFILFFFAMIIYVSVYNIVKYDKKFKDELVIYNELKRKGNRFEK